MSEERCGEALTLEEHRHRHIELHQALDELIADFFAHAPGPGDHLPSRTTIAELMQWSCEQTKLPADHTQFFGHRGSNGVREDQVRSAAAAIANARGGRRGVPPIVDVLDLLPADLRENLLQEARAALQAVRG